jgi:hypothetical protein
MIVGIASFVFERIAPGIPAPNPFSLSTARGTPLSTAGT